MADVSSPRFSAARHAQLKRWAEEDYDDEAVIAIARKRLRLRDIDRWFLRDAPQDSDHVSDNGQQDYEIGPAQQSPRGKPSDGQTSMSLGGIPPYLPQTNTNEDPQEVHQISQCCSKDSGKPAITWNTKMRSIARSAASILQMILS